MLAEVDCPESSRKLTLSQQGFCEALSQISSLFFARCGKFQVASPSFEDHLTHIFPPERLIWASFSMITECIPSLDLLLLRVNVVIDGPISGLAFLTWSLGKLYSSAQLVSDRRYQKRSSWPNFSRYCNARTGRFHHLKVCDVVKKWPLFKPTIFQYMS
jgi:hypothetical protein